MAPPGIWRIIRYPFRLARFVGQTYPVLMYLRVHPNPTVRGRVSIITATYNRPDVLRKAIEYVRAQTYPDWEQIVVSDGYDPRVDAVVAEFGDPRIRSVHTRRFATVGNYQKNYALKYCTGEFVLYFDDDNIIYTHCLQTMVGGFTSDDIGFVTCAINYSDARRPRSEDIMTIKNPKEGFRHREIDQLNYMVRRHLIIAAGGLRFHGAADYLLIAKIARVSKGNYLPDIIGHHI